MKPPNGKKARRQEALKVARGPRKSPTVTLGFAAHEDYVGWMQEQRSLGVRGGEQQVVAAVRTQIAGLTAERAQALAEFLYDAVMAGWEGQKRSDALGWLEVACGLRDPATMGATTTGEGPANGA